MNGRGVMVAVRVFDVWVHVRLLHLRLGERRLQRSTAGVVAVPREPSVSDCL